jgi:hypothetical protein
LLHIVFLTINKYSKQKRILTAVKCIIFDFDGTELKRAFEHQKATEV